MAYGYRRRRYGRRRYGRRKNAYGKYFSTAQRALGLAMSVRKLLNVEKKHIEYYSNATQNNVPTIHFLSGTAQGDTESSRQGNSLLAKLVSAKVHMLHGTGGDNVQVIRLILFIDKVSDGVVPTVAELLDNTVAGGDIARYNTNNAGSRFIILSDTTHTVTSSAEKSFAQLSVTKSLSHHLKYTGTTAAQSDASSGHLYLFAVSSDGGPYPPDLKIDTVVRFIDN